MIEEGWNLGVMHFDRIWSSGGKESCQGLLVVTDVSICWTEVIFRVKWQNEIQTWLWRWQDVEH